MENDGNNDYNEHIVGTDLNYPGSIQICDMDNDGDLDIAAAILIDDDIIWWENEGHYEFTRHLVTSSCEWIKNIVCKDIDGDGDIDIISTAWYANDITLWENTGDQSFSTYLVSDDYQGPTEVEVADLDGDGDYDIIAAYYHSEVIAWYEKIDNGHFLEHEISDEFDEIRSLSVADINMDGFLDIVGVRERGVSWLENDGNLNFEEHSLLNSRADGLFVRAADINGNGLFDIIVSTDEDNTSLLWFEYNGNNDFDFRNMIKLEDAGEQNINTFDIADLDGDTELEIISGRDYDFAIWETVLNLPPDEAENIFPANGALLNEAYPGLQWSCSDPENDHILYTVKFSENNPPENIIASEQSSTSLLISTPLERGEQYFWQIIAVDTFTDTTLSPVWNFSIRNENLAPNVPLAVNPFHLTDNVSRMPDLEWSGGDPNQDDVTYDVYFGTTDPPPLATSAYQGNSLNVLTTLGQVLEANSTYYMQIESRDDSGLTASSDTWSFTTQQHYSVTDWTWEHQPIEAGDLALWRMISSDYDSDGDVDVLGFEYENRDIYVIENQGNNVFEEHLILESNETIKIQDCMDFDLDGDKDILTISNSPVSTTGRYAMIFWENDGNNVYNGQLICEDIRFNFTNSAVDVADIDDDGDFDLIVGGNYEIVLFINNGQMIFFEHVILQRQMENNELKTADLDNDGDLDIVSAQYWPGLSWLENLGGYVFEEHIIDEETDIHRNEFVEVVDIDLDGDLDLLIVVVSQRQFMLYENDGSQNFTQQILSENMNYFKQLLVRDIDGDADIDILLSQRNSDAIDEVLFFQNTGDEVFEIETIISEIEVNELLEAVDIDNDNVLEIIGSYPDYNGVVYWELGDVTGIHDGRHSDKLPYEFAIEQVYPNPFNPTLTAVIALPEISDLKVSIYNIVGQEVAVLANQNYQAGFHSFTFDGSGLASGVYFVKAFVPGQMDEIKKVVLMK